MDKIYNNLTIENLTKTEWFNQFDKAQQKHILYGIEKNLDVSLYAQPENSSLKMCSIISSLEHNLDISYLDELTKVIPSMFFSVGKKNE